MKLMKTILSTNHNRTDAAVTYFIDVSVGDLFIKAIRSLVRVCTWILDELII